MKNIELPILVAHSDWSCGTPKRWIALARLGQDGRYQAQAPEPVGQAEGLLGRLREAAGKGAGILAGFDFPIGLPYAYAQKAGIASFLSFLDEYAQGKWPLLDQPARRP